MTKTNALERTSRVQVVDEIDIEICELIRKVVFYGVWNWSKQEAEFGSVEH